MSIRKVRVIGKEYKGECPESSGPGRLVYQLSPINCKTAQFLEWYMMLPAAQAFVVCGDDKLIDLGGAISLAPGQVIAVSFDEYFDAWLEKEVRAWKKQSRVRWEAAAKLIGI